MQRHTFSNEITCIVAQKRDKMKEVMQRHTFSREKTCVAESERKSCVGNRNEKRTDKNRISLKKRKE